MKKIINRLTVYMKSNTLTILLVLACTLSYIFANGQRSIPILAWTYPFLFLCLTRVYKSAKSAIVIFGIYSIGFFIQWVTVLGMGIGICAMLAVAFSIIKTLPYIAYRKMSRFNDNFTLTILFSAMMVVIEYLIYLINPILAGMSDVYTQYQNLPLMNFSSIFGVYGVIFVMYWTAAFLVWLYSHHGTKGIRKGVITYTMVMAVVFIYGIAMVNLPFNESNTVRIAGITVPVKELLENDDDVSKVFYSNSFTNDNIVATKEKLAEVHDRLLQKTVEEAKAGARIVFWSELNGAVMRDDEAQLISRAAEVVKEQNIYLIISLLTKTPYEDYKDNKVIMILPTGEVASEYYKTVRSPGELCIKGNGKMDSFTSRYGTLTSFICSDMASSTMLSQTGRNGVDIILVPASDWKAMSPIAIRTAIVRGIENGCSIVRQTNMGISVAADYTGRILARVDYYTSESRKMVSEIPTRGRFTIYPYIGNILPLCCLVFVLSTFAIPTVRYMRQKRNKKSMC